HVHIVVRMKPDQQISQLVNSLKGATARRLFQEFPWLNNRLWGGHLWSPSSFVVTVGGAPLDAITQYVESQRKGLHAENIQISHLPQPRSRNEA
ncbi:MAG: IS200/IS605 family transposase, partial [Candidatus Tectomicrobia bacterium]|nr:IS200/IS605 family transposase [Candidatus Tectomicrobia bacterium]